MELPTYIKEQRDNTYDTSVKIIDSVDLRNGKLAYKLIREPLLIEGELFVCYGIEVYCDLFDENETAYINNITSNPTFAKELFKIVSTNQITPIAFKDIVEDFLEEKYSI